MSLIHIFDAVLEYDPELDAIADGAGRQGELVGSGNGVVTGPDVDGVIRWSLFEGRGATLCTMDPVAVIETSDAAEIRLEARGYGQRATTEDTRWSVAATLRFETHDERYRWLDGAIGLWEGEFDSEAGRARYQAYVQADD